MSKAKRYAPVPRLRRAVNAYEFLTEVLPKVILAEPRRMRMGDWAYTAHEALRDLTCVEDIAWADNIKASRIPACGTVGCIGGWTEMMTGQRCAADVLRLSHYQSSELFYNGVLVSDPAQGTLAHARRVVRHLKDFAARYEDQLKATTVEPAWRQR